MWLRRAQNFKLLMDKSVLKKKERIEWTDEMKNAFNKMSPLMEADTLADYPNHNKRFTSTLTLHNCSWGPVSCKMNDPSPISEEI